MITRVYIDNFRCFTNFEIRPERVNLLIGSNGSGKSTFTDVLHRVAGLTVLGNTVDDEFPQSARTRWDSRPTQRIELDISVNGSVYHYEVEILHDLKFETVTLQREVVKYDSRTVFLYEGGMVHLHNNEGKPGAKFPFRGARSFLPQIENRPETTLLTSFLDFVRRVWLLKLNPTRIDPESRGESESLDTDGFNFASWYRYLLLEQQEDLDKLFNRLREMLPGFRALRMVTVGGRGKRGLVADFSFSESKSKYEIDFDDLSDGERAIIILYCLLMDAERKPRILLLDEPENFVGLQIIQPWLVDLADAMRDEGQLFLISHHPEVIDYLAADHPLLFERPGGGPTIVRTAPFDRSQGLKASELVARGLLDGK